MKNTLTAFYGPSEVQTDLDQLPFKPRSGIDAVHDFMAFLTSLCHSESVRGGWWHDPETGEPLEREKGTLLCLIHSEISEAMEGERKDLADDKLPWRSMAEVELADAIIRICDYAGAADMDLAGAILDKIQFNRAREDHKPENRVKDGGKGF